MDCGSAVCGSRISLNFMLEYMNMNKDFLINIADRLYGVALLDEIPTGNPTSLVYEAAAGQNRYILKVQKYSEQRASHMEFESGWVSYLSEYMNGIAKTVTSRSGRAYETAAVGTEQYILSLQQKAEGKIVDVNNPDEFNIRLFKRLGGVMGQMHSLTTHYDKNISSPEFKWNGPNFWRAGLTIPDADVRRSESLLVAEIERLPAGSDSYGIVHFDIHTDNLLIDRDGSLTVIDFDTCQFNWYAADIASALFLALMKKVPPRPNRSESERTDFAEAFLRAYLEGYRETRALDRYWLSRLDLFMRYQMVDEYMAAKLYWPDTDDELREWYVGWHRDRLVQGLPYVCIDYNKFF